MPMQSRGEHPYLPYSSTTRLCNNNEVCPPIFYAGAVECSISNSRAIVIDSLRPKITHANTRFDRSQRANTRSPLRMS